VTCNFDYSTSVNCVACQSSQRKRERDREREKETTDCEKLHLYIYNFLRETMKNPGQI
jgi:hypothetical protein